MTAVLADQVDMYAANLGSTSGLLDKVQPLAVTSIKRWPDLPDVPSLDELGINCPKTDTFQGLLAPAAAPQPVIDRLAKELTAIPTRPDIGEKYAKISLPVVAEGSNAFRARIAHEVPIYKAVIEKAGLKIQ